MENLVLSYESPVTSNGIQILQSRYFLKNSDGSLMENTPDELFTRVAFAVSKAEEDSEYWGRILSIYRGCFLPEKLVRYRVHQGSTQNKTNNSYLNEQLIFCRVLSQSVDIPIIIKIMKIIKIYIKNILRINNHNN